MKRLLPLAALFLQGAAPPPISGAGYLPTDADERGLWMQVDEVERQFKTSNFVMRDPALNAYVRQVFCKTVGEAECKDVRIYIVRTAYFNASMAPNGMMQVWSGLLLRTRDEAQLAAVLGHEYAHYQKRHTVRLFRDIKAKTNAAAWLSVIPVGGWVGAGIGLASLGMVGTIFGNSREMEREADATALPMMAKAGYDPKAASQVWAQIRAEDEATALARGTKKRREGGMFATHPTSLERQQVLDKRATDLTSPTAAARNAAEYRAALGPWFADLIDDQIKLNDFGGTEMLIGQLAATGWTSDLLYARGELYRARGAPDDFVKAAGFYREAIAKGDAPVEAQRGLGLALLRSGDRAGGQAALKAYLTARPDAKDKSMIAMMAGVTS